MRGANAAQAPDVVKTTCKYGIVLAAVAAGGIGWCMTALVLNGSMEDFKLLDAMTPTSESTFDRIFVVVLVSGLVMFGTSLMGCIGVLRGHKGMMFAFSIVALIMAIALTMCATNASMILTGSIPPIIMQTNRICRNYDQVHQELGCLETRRLGDAPPKQPSLAKQAWAWHAMLAFQEEAGAGRRLEAGTTELQLVERIAANQNEEKCSILVDVCKLPEGVKDMTTACTCNGYGVVDMRKNGQKEMNWACPQRIETEQAPPECGSFCADWDGSGDLSKSWCFVNRQSDCQDHILNLNETFGEMEPSTEACRAFTLIQYPWSGMVSRGIFVAKVGMGLTSALAALMFFSTISAWFIIWCTPGNRFFFSEAMALQPLKGGGAASDSDIEGMSRASSQRSRSRRDGTSSVGDDASSVGGDDRSAPVGRDRGRAVSYDSTPYQRE